MKCECGNNEPKKKAGDECSKCGAEYLPAEFKPRAGDVQISDDVILRYGLHGGFEVRVKGRPIAYPSTWYGVLKHIRDCRVRGAALKTVAELVKIEQDQDRLMRGLATLIMQKMGDKKA